MGDVTICNFFSKASQIIIKFDDVIMFLGQKKKIVIKVNGPTINDYCNRKFKHQRTVNKGASLDNYDQYMAYAVRVY